MSWISRCAREPLVHFVAIGAAMFAVFHWSGAGGSGSHRIIITPGQVEAIVAGFSRTWQRPPTEEELKGQLDEYVREEIATREAMAMGLDRDDTIIRRRLRQKLEFLVEDTVTIAPPTDAELQAWLEAHPEQFQLEPEVAFRQVFLDPERRRATLQEDVRRLRRDLSAAGPDVPIETLGDSRMLPIDVPRSSRSNVARQFGDSFADAVVAAERGRWVGPIESGYGQHLVYVSDRLEPRLPLLPEVRQLVEREVLAERRKRELAAMYRELLTRYRVVIEQRPVAAVAASER